MKLNIYLLSRMDIIGYDEYDSAVVVSESEEKARCIDPSGFYRFHDNAWYFQYADGSEKREKNTFYGWVHPKDIEIRKVGETTSEAEGTVLCSSFNAG